MAARIDPFIDVLLRERGDQLYLLPDEPVTMVKSGQSRRISKQPLTDEHIYALLVEMAPPESADRIDQSSETTFDYAADRGLVRVRIVPELGRLTAVVAPIPKGSQPGAPSAAPAAPPAAPKPPRSSAIAAAPMVETTAGAGAAVGAGAPATAGARRAAGAGAPAPAATAAPTLPAEFAAPQYQSAERALGELLKKLVQSKSSDLHLRVGEPPLFRTNGEIARQAPPPVSGDQLELLLLAIMPERNRAEWTETGDSDFAYEIAGLARVRVHAARDRTGPVAVFRVIPAPVVSAEQLG